MYTEHRERERERRIASIWISNEPWWRRGTERGKGQGQNDQIFCWKDNCMTSRRRIRVFVSPFNPCERRRQQRNHRQRHGNNRLHCVHSWHLKYRESPGCRKIKGQTSPEFRGRHEEKANEKIIDVVATVTIVLLPRRHHHHIIIMSQSLHEPIPQFCPREPWRPRNKAIQNSTRGPHVGSKQVEQARRRMVGNGGRLCSSRYQRLRR